MAATSHKTPSHKHKQQQKPAQGKQQQSQQQSQKKPIPLVEAATATIKRLEKTNPGLQQQLKKAYGYAIFPSVGKAALVVGGAYGRGAVFERGKHIGYATIGQLTIGVQIGGDTFSEIIVFDTKDALEQFKQGYMAFAANASAVLVKAGAAGTSNFKGVRAMAYSHGGMLLEAVIGGQKFKFRPLGEDDEDEQGSGKGKSGAEASGQNEEGEDAEDQGEEDQGDDDQQDGQGLASRALTGIRDAASKTTDLAKEHPIATTVIAAGLATGLGLLLVRRLRDAQGQDSSEDDQQDDAQGSADDQGEGEDDEQQDDDDEEQDAKGSYDDDDGDEDEEEHQPHGAGARNGRRRF